MNFLRPRCTAPAATARPTTSWTRPGRTRSQAWCPSSTGPSLTAARTSPWGTSGNYPTTVSQANFKKAELLGTLLPAVIRVFHSGSDSGTPEWVQVRTTRKDVYQCSFGQELDNSEYAYGKDCQVYPIGSGLGRLHSLMIGFCFSSETGQGRHVEHPRQGPGPDIRLQRLRLLRRPGPV